MQKMTGVVKSVKRKAKKSSKTLQKLPKHIKVEVTRLIKKMNIQMHNRLAKLEKKIQQAREAVKAKMSFVKKQNILGNKKRKKPPRE